MLNLSCFKSVFLNMLYYCEEPIHTGTCTLKFSSYLAWGKPLSKGLRLVVIAVISENAYSGPQSHKIWSLGQRKGLEISIFSQVTFWCDSGTVTLIHVTHCEDPRTKVLLCIWASSLNKIFPSQAEILVWIHTFLLEVLDIGNWILVFLPL